MRDVNRNTINGLRELADKLKSGEEIAATELHQEQTPDGPVTTRRKVLLRARKGEE